MSDDWRPRADLSVLHLRARMLARIRAFFAAANVLEVDTPTLSVAATTDPNIASFITSFHGPEGGARYLHTSPELPMKRLLAAGSGPIYQICKVFRDGEAGRRHNPEFTLLEWYRPGWDHHALMEEVEGLVRAAVGPDRDLPGAQYLSYREAFLDAVGVDPLSADARELRAIAVGLGIEPPREMQSVDGWLDLLMTHHVEAALPPFAFLYDYPASQAALARVRREDYPVAERFELYLDGVEIANGFHELVDAREQRARFRADNAHRRTSGLPEMPVDERFLAALEAGMPPSAGVAIGIDRLLLSAIAEDDIRRVVCFPNGSA
ncbi:MAG: EF-P lysine aminoacylase GenX [Gammaproteobacteria bacterium]|nr:EF-P lysine aminoacylase GenX [Gammaproteobacteria bacterium]MCP5137307.1 EF-P lysine aminoacylase GenX [Gammaproteobacteria bacterium]